MIGFIPFWKILTMELLLEYPNDEKIVFFPQESITESELKNLVKTATGLQSFTLKIWNEKFKKHVNLHDYSSVIDGSRILVSLVVIPQVTDEGQVSDGAQENPVFHQSLQDLNLDCDSVPIEPLECSLRTERWERGNFKINIEDFDGLVRTELQHCINEYELHGKGATLLSCKLQSAIRDKLQFYLQKFTSYPTYEHIADACKSLVETFPCLRGDRNDLTGYSRWVTTMGHRLNYYRRTHTSDPEISVNSGFGKLRCGRRAQRPLKGELNFKPAFPIFTTEDSLKLVKEKIVLEMNKTQPDRGYIDRLMETTFSLRRLEVTETDVLKTMSEWKVQWPELCFAAQLRKEMLRLNLTDFQAMLKSFAATVENTFVPLALECRRRRLVQATVSAAAVNGISLNSDIVSLNLPPQDVMTQENMLQELPHLLKDKHPFLVKSGEEPSEYPLNEGHIKKEGDKFSIWVDQVKMVKDITSLNESCWLLSAVYYTYNLKYSQHFKHSLIFLQRVCGVAKSPLSRKVDNLLAQLQVSRN